MTATTYISEIAPTRARGAALGFYQLFVRFPNQYIPDHIY